MSGTIPTIYPLGTEGWIPANGMETLSLCFFYDDELFIIDAGTGVSRLMELKNTIFSDRWPGIKRLNVFLSHYHFDHIIGLFWTRGFLRGTPTRVYAPGKEVYGNPAEELLAGIFRKPYSPYPLHELIGDLEVIDLEPPQVTVSTSSSKINVGVKVNRRHSDPSVALRFNDWFAFVTDTPPEEATIEFIRGVKVVLHEAYFDSGDFFEDEDDELLRHTGGPHTGSHGAGIIAHRAGVKRGYLIHHNPEGNMLEVENYSRKVSDALGLDCRPARDLEEITFD